MSLGRTRCDLSVVSDLKTVRMPCCCRQQRRASDNPLTYGSTAERGIVKCLYNRSKHLITKPSVISQEKKHLSSVLVSNGYPFSFVKNTTKTKKQTATKE